MMRYLSAIRYVFSEPQWGKKLLIPGVLGLIPFVGIPYILGWTAQIIQNTVQNQKQDLPEVFRGEYLLNGFKLCLGFLLYYMPMLLLLGIKTLFLKLIQGWLPIEATSAIDKVLGVTCSGIQILYLILFLIIVPYVLIVFTQDFSFRSLLDLRGIYVFCKHHLTEIFPMTVVLCIAILFAAFGTSLLIVGVCFTLPYSCAVFARLLGENLLVAEIRSES